MTRVLLTGMSGTGKSSVIATLAARGLQAIDTDDHGLSEWTGAEWLWRENRIQRLLALAGPGPLFLSGCVRNQAVFYPQFDHVVLLSAPADVLVARLAARTTNDYGKHPDELAEVLENLRTVEPLLRAGATLEVDTTMPLERVIETILTHVGTTGITAPSAE